MTLIFFHQVENNNISILKKSFDKQVTKYPSWVFNCDNKNTISLQNILKILDANKLQKLLVLFKLAVDNQKKTLTNAEKKSSAIRNFALKVSEYEVCSNNTYPKRHMIKQSTHANVPIS